jgi:hypothetical protein
MVPKPRALSFSILLDISWSVLTRHRQTDVNHPARERLRSVLQGQRHLSLDSPPHSRPLTDD